MLLILRHAKGVLFVFLKMAFAAGKGGGNGRGGGENKAGETRGDGEKGGKRENAI